MDHSYGKIGAGTVRIDSTRHRHYGGTSILLLALLLLALPGCSGGAPDLYSRDKNGNQVPNFVLRDTTPLPGNHAQRPKIVSATATLEDDLADRSDPTDNDEDEEGEDKKNDTFEPDPENWRIKPNHWITVQNEGYSKKEDFNGVLKHSMRLANLQYKQIPGTRYFLRSQRPASLVKEQLKRFEAPIIAPDHPTLTVVPELETNNGVELVREVDRFLELKPHQYHMVLLTDSPENYSFFRFMPSVWNVRLNQYLMMNDASMFDSIDDTSVDYSENPDKMQIDALYYKLTISDWDNGAELPSQLQQWTSIAYLIWTDGYSPGELTEDQKLAMIDWLHFGGQLIVCGDAINNLKGSFLEPFLPVTAKGQANANGAQMTRMVRNWSLETDTNGDLVSPTFSEDENLLISTWELNEQGQELPDCEGLVAEREVGKGRTVCVAFPINHNKLRSWSGLDNWFNSCLLRRPGRNFTDLDSLEFYESADKPRGFAWKTIAESEKTPTFYTQFRLATRDWNTASLGATNRLQGSTLNQHLLQSAEQRRFSNSTDPTTHSPAAWNDYSRMASAARQTLKDQAGITPPKREWVLKALMIYLAILVPVNYLIFRLVGRLEWAWFAIPLISVIGGITVVRAASLDIGFSNKRLQINVVEFAPGYSRAHLAGFGSLYSSLTSSFQYESENPSTVALPFPTADVSTPSAERPVEFRYEVGRQPRFGPQSVLSNTMEMYRFEQQVDLGGSFQLSPDQSQLSNQSSLVLQDTVLLRSNAAGSEILAAKVGKLAPGQNTDLNWQTVSDLNQMSQLWDDTVFADLEYQFQQRQEQLADAELVFENLTWVELASFYLERDPAYSESITLMADKLQMTTDQSMSYGNALAAFRESRLTDELNLGRFSRISCQFPLGPGEVRMIAWSDDPIDNFAVTPSASQVNVRNFIVGQLARPALPGLGRDQNLAYKPKNQKQKETEEEIDPEGSNNLF